MDKRLFIALEPGNQSTVTEFIMLGLTANPDLQILLFTVLLPVYVFTLLGNISILVIVWFSNNLHTPMYFFLTQLCLLDITLSSDISPNMLVHLLKQKKAISFNGCIVQVFFFSACASTEFFLLSAMALDRYVAICNPLQYALVMTKGLCVRLVAASYIGGFMNSLIHTGLLFRLRFCGPNVLNDFICDYPAILNLSCTDTSINDLLRLLFAAVIVICSFVVVFVSYVYIVRAILRIRTAAGRLRAASTCISHFTCVFLFYSSSFFMEVIPNATSSEVLFKVASVTPTVIIPSLNPLIYSLRNNEVKGAICKLIKTITKSPSR